MASYQARSWSAASPTVSSASSSPRSASSTTSTAAVPPLRPRQLSTYALSRRSSDRAGQPHHCVVEIGRLVPSPRDVGLQHRAPRRGAPPCPDRRRRVAAATPAPPHAARPRRVRRRPPRNRPPAASGVTANAVPLQGGSIRRRLAAPAWPGSPGRRRAPDERSDLLGGGYQSPDVIVDVGRQLRTGRR